MSFIQIEKPRPHVTLVTLNRPERMNAMAFDVMIPLRDALREISIDNECRVVVLTGAGHGFCSGADLVGGGMVPNIDGLKRTSIARRALKVLDDVILAIRDMHQPVIAAVNGAAIGGGQQQRTYTVQAGDSLSKISKQFYGNVNEYMRIFEANRDQLDDPNKIQPGQKLVIPA